MPNSVIDAYRQKFDDSRSDDEIILDLGNQYPDVLKSKPDFAADYSRITRELTRATRPPISAELGRSFRSGVDQVQAKLYDTAALAGDIVGSNRLKRFGEEGYQRNIEEAQPNRPTVPNIENIEGAGDAARYVLGLVGSQAPQLGLTASAALAGTAVGGLAGGAVAAGAAGFSQMQNRAELKAHGAKDVTTTAVAVGTLGSILESLVPLALAKKAFQGASQTAAKEYTKRVLKKVPLTALQEASTEVAQEVVSIAGEMYANRDNKDFKIPREEILSRLVNNGLAGGLLGGAAGAVGAIPGQREPAAPKTFDKTVEERYGVDKVSDKIKTDLTSLKEKERAGELSIIEKSALQNLDPAERAYWTLLGDEKEPEATTPPVNVEPGVVNGQANEARTEIETQGREEVVQQSIASPSSAGMIVPDDGSFTEAEIAEIEARYPNVGKKNKSLSADEPSPATSEAPVVEGAATLSQPDPRRAAVMRLLNQKEAQDEELSVAAKRLQDRRAIQQAEAQTNPAPTPEQKQSGNYAKGPVDLDGINIDVETPMGAERTGKKTVGKQVFPWSVTMPATYGEIKGVTVDGKVHKATGADGDKVDIYIGPNTASPKVWVIDQKDPKTGKFDEHKVMYAFSGKEEAMATYIGAFSDNSGASRIGAITEMTKDELKQWIADGATKVPLGSLKTSSLLTSEDVLNAIDWERAPVADKETKLGTREGKGSKLKQEAKVVNTILKEPFFEFEGTDFKEDDKKRLVSQAAVKGGSNSDTHRITFFEDNDTSAVIGLPTYSTRSHGFEVRVGILPGETKGQTLDSLMALERYTPLSSILSLKPVRATDPNSTVVFKDYRAYQDKLRDAARQRVESQKQEVAAQEELARSQAEKQSIDAEGNVESQGAGGEAAPGHEDLLDQWRDFVIDQLPKLADGSIRKKLTARDIKRVVMDGFQDRSTFNLQRFAALEVLHEIGEAEWFKQLPDDQKAQTVFDRIAERTYEAYVKGGFFGEAEAAKTIGSRGATNLEALAGSNEGVTDTGPAGTGAEAARARNSDTLFRSISPIEQGGGNRATLAQVIEAINTAIEGIAAAGFNVAVFQQNLQSAIEFYRTEGGGFLNAANLVSLVFGDAVNPTIEGLRSTLHEGAHALFSKETPVTREAIRRAIDRLSDEELGLKGSADARIRQSNPSRLEDIAQERLAEHLAQTIDPFKARSMAAALWRLIKDAYLRAASAIAKAFYGQNAKTDAMALAWFRNNMERVARNEVRWSMIDWLGGGRVSTADISRMGTKLTGERGIAFRWNAEEGRMEYRDILPKDPESMGFNLFRKMQGVNAPRRASIDQDPAIKLPDVAAQNSLEAGLRDLWSQFNTTGSNRTSTGDPLFQTYSEFLQFILPEGIKAPSVVIAAHNADLQRNQLTPVDPTKQILDLSENSQRDAANRGVGLWNNVVGKWSKRAQEADEDLSGRRGSAQSKFDKNARRVTRLASDYTNVETLMNLAKDSFQESLKEMADGLKEVRSEAGRSGVLAKTIEVIEGQMTDDIARRYQAAMNDLFKRISDNPRTQTRFYDLLRSVAELGIDFQTQSPAQIREAVRTDAQYDPALMPLVAMNENGGFSRESNALLAITISFARRDALAMHALSVQRSANAEEKALVDGVIAAAVSDSRDAIATARKMAARSTKLNGRFTLILNTLEKIQTEQRVLKQQLDQAKLFHDFYSNNIKTIDAHRQALERVLGAQGAMFEATAGAKYPLPPGPNAPAGWSRDPQNLVTFQYTRDAAADTVLKENIRTMQEYLDSHPQGTPGFQSADYNSVDQALEQLKGNEIQHMVTKPVQSLLVKVMGSVPAMLKAVGLPEAAAASRKIIQYVDRTHRFRSDTNKIGIRVELAERDAMKALGITDRELFRTAVFDSGLTYAQNRKDIQFSHPDQDSAVRALMPELRLYLMGDVRLRDAITKPGGWSAVEAFFMEHHRASLELTKISAECGIKVQDDANGFFRVTKGAPLFESLKYAKGSMFVMFDRMRESWDQFSWATLKQDIQDNPQQTIQALQGLFTPEVWRDFVTPLANRPGTSFFDSPTPPGGIADLASVANTKAALDASNGSIQAFSDALFQLSGGTGDSTAFLVETMDTLKNAYDSIHGMESERSNAKPTAVGPGLQLMMNARLSEEMPAEWVGFRMLDRHGMTGVIEHFAFHGSFGRNGTALWNDFQMAQDKLRDLASEYNKIVELAKAKSGDKSDKTLRRAMQAEAAARGTDLQKAAEAAKGMALLTNSRKFLEDLIRLPSEASVGMRSVANVVSAMVGTVLQGVGSAFIDTTTLFKPIMEFGVSGTSLKMVGTNLKSFAAGNVGSLAGTVGMVSKWDAEHYKKLVDIGHYDSDNEITLKEKVKAVLHSNQRTLETSMIGQLKADVARAADIASGTVLAALSTGFSRQSDPLFPTFKPFAPFTHTGLMINAGAISGMWQAYSDMVARAVEHFRSNPQDLANQSFKFNGPQLHYNDRFGGVIADERTFNELIVKLAENRMSLERLARDFIRRGQGPILTHESLKRISRLTINDIVSDPSIASRAGRAYSSKTLRVALPLVGWSIQQFVGLGKTFRGAEGQTDRKALLSGLISIGAMMGVSLTYSLLKDLYEEDVLNKKANVMSLSDEAFFASAVDRMARIGMPFGFGGDFINSLVNRDIQRDFSIDSRVFAVNSATQLAKSLSTLYHQDWTRTYATFDRQMVMALGGSGYLQNAQIINNMISGDNAEARVTSRINVNNWLRSTGRTIGMEVKTSKGQDYLPTPLTPWITEMQLAAFAGDFGAFNDAKREAIQRSREAGDSDPAAAVAKAFASRHPLRSIFKSPPTHDQYRKLLAAMPDGGREDVEEAIGLFNRFLERLGLNAYEGKSEERTHGRAASLSADPMAMRRMAASSFGGLGF